MLLHSHCLLLFCHSAVWRGWLRGRGGGWWGEVVGVPHSPSSCSFHTWGLFSVSLSVWQDLSSLFTPAQVTTQLSCVPLSLSSPGLMIPAAESTCTSQSPQATSVGFRQLRPDLRAGLHGRSQHHQTVTVAQADSLPEVLAVAPRLSSS